MSASAALWPGGDPDRHTQHLLFQTLVGAWPLSVERASAYLAKATKEAKLRTTWTEPNPAYDEARDAYVIAVLGDSALVADIEAFVDGLVWPGRVNALALALLQLTVPGVPDTYQGSELWDLSLVDPDNRRPVDFALRRSLLAEIGSLTPAEVLDRADEGLPKLRVVREALHLRRRRPWLFGSGAAAAYEPLHISGAAASHVVGFTRGGSGDNRQDGAAVAVIVPRLVLGRDLCLPGAPTRRAEDRRVPTRGRQSEGWGDTTVALPPGEWVDVLTGQRRAGGELALGELLADFPVALLERGSGA